jgi:hypothetical protein
VSIPVEEPWKKWAGAGCAWATVEHTQPTARNAHNEMVSNLIVRAQLIDRCVWSETEIGVTEAGEDPAQRRRAHMCACLAM